uniref:Uncharacterized protein n=1 Tax=biofilter metagenome TaxID=1070537 RepID=A0A193SCV9_9ZZZZ
MSGRSLKFIIIDELDQPQPPRWRHPFSRYGCERSHRLISRFPEQADRIARRSARRVHLSPKSKHPQS